MPLLSTRVTLLVCALAGGGLPVAATRAGDESAFRPAPAFDRTAAPGWLSLESHDKEPGTRHETANLLGRDWLAERSVGIDEFDPWTPEPKVRANDDFELTPVALSLPPLPNIIGGRLRGEWLDDFDDRTRVGGRLILDSSWLLGVDAEGYQWREVSPLGRRNSFWTGDANLIARFGHGTPVRFQSGLGVNWLDDGGSETEIGFNTTYGLDVQFKQWLTAGGQVDWGRLGSEKVFHGQATLGAMLGGLELYIGYDWYNLGHIDRKGPIAGVGLWF
jgi:hypothetical protein